MEIDSFTRLKPLESCGLYSPGPASNNGFGLSPGLALIPMRGVSEVFNFVDDVPGIFDICTQLVQDFGVSGTQVHDANHVAAMISHGIEEILTLDKRDFLRYPQIRVRALV